MTTCLKTHKFTSFYSQSFLASLPVFKLLILREGSQSVASSDRSNKQPSIWRRAKQKSVARAPVIAFPDSHSAHLHCDEGRDEKNCLKILASAELQQGDKE